MQKIGEITLDPAEAFSTFQAGLRHAMLVSPVEMNKRIVADNAGRESQRIEAGRPKRGPKRKAV
jgi:hypothetical protein